MRAVLLAFGCSVLSVPAVQGPSESATEFIRKLSSGDVDLAPQTDTAIEAEVSPEKRESIQHRLQRLARELAGEQIEIGPIRTEGSLAGVIVRRVDREDPMLVRILALSMVRTGEKWRPGPVPASFENTSAAFSRSTRTIAGQLEDWLVREQTQEVERFRKSAAQNLRQSLADSLSPETIRSWTAQEAFSAFMEACDRREISRILALMGGLSDPLPDDWFQLSNAVRNGINSRSSDSGTWTLLTSPSVVRMGSLENDIRDGGQTFRVLFLDPRSGEDSFFREQAVSVCAGHDGLWQIQVPDSGTLVLDPDAMLKRSATLLTRGLPSRPAVSALALKEALLGSLQSPASSFSCLDWIGRDNQAVADLHRLKTAVQMRWETMDPDRPIVPVELGFLEEADHALLAMQWLSLGQLAYAPRIFHLQRMPSGWVWNTAPGQKEVQSADKWLGQMESTWRESLLEQAVSACGTPDFSLPSPTEAAASALVGDWLDAIYLKNFHHALSQCARLRIEKSPALLLRNLGYECKASLLDIRPLSVEIVQRGKSITLVATRTSDNKRSIRSLLPVVSTPAGARILMEIDLGPPSRPGRAFINRNAIDRLSPAHADAAEELGMMIAKHLEDAAD